MTTTPGGVGTGEPSTPPMASRRPSRRLRLAAAGPGATEPAGSPTARLVKTSRTRGAGLGPKPPRTEVEGLRLSLASEATS